MNRRQLGQVELAPEPHQQRVLQIVAGWHHRQKMRLVRNEQMRIAMDDFSRERNLWLGLQFAIVVIAQPRHECSIRTGLVSRFADHLTSCHAAQPVCAPDSGQAFAQKVDQQAPALGGQDHTARADAIAHRQNLGIVGVMHGAGF